MKTNAQGRPRLIAGGMVLAWVWIALAPPFLLGLDLEKEKEEVKPPAWTKEQLTGPFRHKNLEIYLLKRNSDDPAVLPDDLPLITLEEGLASGQVIVKETGTVSQLTIENKSPHHLYVHAGDIVKGGKQDRTIPNTFTLAPGSGPMDVGAFCVESGRWEQRGNEKLAVFASSKNLANSVALKQAAQIGKSQGAVWANVGRVQIVAGGNIGTNGAIQGAASPTSLQLTLESPDYRKAIAEYTEAILSQVDDKQIAESFGCVYALHGKFHSADDFFSRTLFRKMWPKLLEAMAAEAIAEYQKDKKSLPLAKDGFILAMSEARDAAVKIEKLAAGNFNNFQIGNACIAVSNSGTIGGKTVLVSGNVSVKTDFAKPEAAGNGLLNNGFLNNIHQGRIQQGIMIPLRNGNNLPNPNPPSGTLELRPAR